jgi:hypothetical protein
VIASCGTPAHFFHFFFAHISPPRRLYKVNPACVEWPERRKLTISKDFLQPFGRNPSSTIERKLWARRPVGVAGPEDETWGQRAGVELPGAKPRGGQPVSVSRAVWRENSSNYFAQIGPEDRMYVWLDGLLRAASH